MNYKIEQMLAHTKCQSNKCFASSYKPVTNKNGKLSYENTSDIFINT